MTPKAGAPYHGQVPVRESTGDRTRSMGRNLGYRENEEMRLGTPKTGGRCRILGVDRRRQIAAFQIRGSPRRQES